MRPLVSIRGSGGAVAVAFALCHLHPVGGSLNINIGDGWRDTDIGGASLSSSHRMEVIVDSCWGVAQAVHLNKQYLRPPALLINVATERLMCAHVEPVSAASLPARGLSSTWCREIRLVKGSAFVYTANFPFT